MIKNFLKQLKDIKITKKSRILLALSGGVDSMVLMDLLYRHNYKFSVAHCNFCLRGEDSDLDQQFITSWSKSRNITFFIKKFNTKEYAKKNKISIQMAARDLRYNWFNNLYVKYDFNFIATAHHLNDSVETILFHLIRGTGIAGLHGIKVRDNHIIRPLVQFSKEDLLQYAHENDIEYRVDSSNSDNKYIRNKIRNKIIPIMKEINPDLISSMGKTISKLGAVENIYNQSILDKKIKLLIQDNDEYKIDINALLKQPSPKQVLYELISDFGFYDIDSVFSSFSSPSGREFFNDKFYMVKDRFFLVISKHIANQSFIIHEDTTSIQDLFDVKFRVAVYSQFDILKQSTNTMCLDYSKLEFPLLIRPWKEGDSFIPLGMRGSKKLSDYFIDKKYSLIQKKKTRVLISNNKITCIIGERLDDRFKLVETSKKVYIVTV
ncbi:MAG: tRNA lysidine(34) synthetase TilS [Flavobacteriales bacterium]|nr:tRNA lysidine(34) synthetase TilS [Flavobacteriales bacterium]